MCVRDDGNLSITKSYNFYSYHFRLKYMPMQGNDTCSVVAFIYTRTAVNVYLLSLLYICLMALYQLCMAVTTFFGIELLCNFFKYTHS